MYAGSLHPVERLDLNQRINGDPPPYYTIEQLFSTSLIQRGSITDRKNVGPIKYRYSVGVISYMINSLSLVSKSTTFALSVLSEIW